MKHFIFFCLFFYILCVACSRVKYTPAPYSDFSVEDARKNFETNAQDLKYANNLFGGISVKSDIIDIVPNWNLAQIHQRKDLTTIMVPIMEKGKYRAVLTESLGDYVRAKYEDAKVESYLVVQKKATRDDPFRFVSTVIGVSKKPQDNPYMYTGNRSAFEGYMLLSTEQGDVFKVLYYHNGRVSRLTKHNCAHESDNLIYSYRLGVKISSGKISTKSGGGYSTGDVCDSYCFSCHEFSSFENGVCSFCGAPAEEIGNDSWEYFCQQCGRPLSDCTCSPNPTVCPVCGQSPCICYSICPFCGEAGCGGECLNNYGGGSGNSGTNGPINGGNSDIGTPYIVSNSDVLIKNNIPNNIGSQVANTCFFACLEYLSLLFDNNINAGVFLTIYFNDLGGSIDVILNGIPNDEATLLALVQSKYSVGTFTTFNNAIDNGNPVLCLVNPEIDSLHCIVVVGYLYNDPSTIIFMDPYDGILKTTPESSIYDESFHFEITGLK